MIISIDSEKAFTKIQHFFIIKNTQQSGIEETYLNIQKATYKKRTARIILNAKKLKTFSMRSEISMHTLTSFTQLSIGSHNKGN